MNDANTLFPPCGLVNFSRIVYRGISRRSPGSVSSKPISTKFIGSTAGDNGAGCWGVGVPTSGAVAFWAGVTGVEVTGCELAGWETVAGVAEVAGAGVIGAEGGGIRVTGVVMGLGTLGAGIGLILPVGGGIRVTGVITRGVTGGTGAGLLFGTGGMGAARSGGFCVDVAAVVIAGIVVTGVLETVGTGVTGLGTVDGVCDTLGTCVVVVAWVGVAGTAGVDKDDFEVPKRLAARIYCAKAACCSCVAVLFATACRIALNSGLVAAISVKAFTVRALELEVVCVGVGIGAATRGLVALAALAAFSAFSASSSTLRTDRKRVSGNM